MGEVNTFVSDAIKIGGFDKWMTINTNAVKTMLITMNKQNIGAFGSHVGMILNEVIACISSKHASRYCC